MLTNKERSTLWHSTLGKMTTFHFDRFVEVIEKILTDRENKTRLEEAKLARKYWHENDCVDGIHIGHGGDAETCQHRSDWHEYISGIWT